VFRPQCGARRLLYLAIAFGVLPVLVPLAVGALEPLANRRRVGVFTATGVVVAVVLMYAVVRGPVEASIEGHHIAHRLDLWHGGIIVTLYVVATCGSMLVRSTTMSGGSAPPTSSLPASSHG
jgi:multisubunit Na+/H+ antiporter MnhB subunit